MIEIHPLAKISKMADIEDSIRGTSIVIGESSRIDAFVKIKPAGGMGDLTIGKNTVVNSGCVIYTGNGVVIGNNVAIASNCTIAPVNHEFRDKNILIRDQGFMPSRGGIIIEDDVWIGANSVILDGAILKYGCIIAAGSVVRGLIPSYSVNAGLPLANIGWRK